MKHVAASRLKATNINWNKVKKKKGDKTMWYKLRPITKKMKKKTAPIQEIRNGFSVKSIQGPLFIQAPKVGTDLSSVNESISKSPGTEEGGAYVIRQRKVLLLPNPEQKKKLLQMISDATETFNLARNDSAFQGVVAAYSTFDVSSKDFKQLPKAPIHREVAKRIVTESALTGTSNEFLTRTPFDIRDNAVKDAVSNLKGDLTKFKKSGGLHSFKQLEIGHRDTIRFNQSCGLYVDLTDIHAHKISVYPRFFNDSLTIELGRAFPFPENVAGGKKSKNSKMCYAFECSIHYDRVRERFSLLVPYKVSIPDSHVAKIEEFSKPNHGKVLHANSNEVIALDPGIRCFMTGYDGMGLVHELGENASTVLNEEFNSIDKMSASYRRLEEQGKPLKRLLVKINKKHERISQKIELLHIEVANWIARRYKIVFLPTFDTSFMKRKAGSVLPRITRRQMNQIAFFKFKQRLLHACTLTGTLLYITTEEYTTKSCAMCGIVGEALGTAQNFQCGSCGFLVGRDVNGAINNLRKNLQVI